jgi:4-hydroxybenzoate polyprenyltransferase
MDEKEKTPVPLLSLRFVRAFWTQLRPYLFFISGVSGLIGLCEVRGLPLLWLGAGSLAFFFSYGLGQALTDCFQMDTDAISSPYRPLVRGTISRGQVLALSILGLLCCGLVFIVMNPLTIPVVLIAIIGLAAYTPFKRMWWSGPFWNAWIVATLPLIGKIAATVHLADVLTVRLAYLMVSVFFSYAIFVLLGYFKDIAADRQTGYRTLPVVFGRGVSVVVSAVFGLIAAVASGLLLWDCGILSGGLLSGLMSGVPWALGVVVLGVAHVQSARIREDAEAFPAIENVVRSYVLIHLAEALALRPGLIYFAPLYYVAFEVALKLRPEKTQI